METGDGSCAKKTRLLSPPGYRVKQEVPPEEVQDEARGGSALMVVDTAAAARSEVVVRIDIDRDMLHCPLCTLPLKPPSSRSGIAPNPLLVLALRSKSILKKRAFLQCEVGHLVCGGCLGQLRANQCHSCNGDGGGGAYTHCPAMDALFAKAMVPCPHQAYGCRASVAYYQAAAHGSACPHQPCLCAEPGCAFVGSPPALLAHLAAPPHSWPVDEVRYGESLHLRMPEHEARRLLLAAEEDGGGGPRVFVITVGDRTARVVPVTLACVRAPGAAAAGPQYTCKMWATWGTAAATGKVETLLLEMEVPNAVSAGGDAEEAAKFLPVLRDMLRGESREMLLSVRIDRASG
ncbi:unnamed protein product [Urochloa decumbens]|uniref:SIAH-type domain-containing protein n=1 Tax=Urochloa decumbens TaxID=240449 RepID=A0ABC8Z981_9POAL